MKCETDKSRKNRQAAEVKAFWRLAMAAPDLLKFAKWARGQMCGDSGTGASYWEQFPEFVAGMKAIKKAEGRK